MDGLFKNNEGSELNEKTQIKRKYAEHSAIHVMEKAPVRNKVIEFVGKRFVTEEELKNFVNGLNETNAEGKKVDSKWLSRNSRYFESVSNRGQRVITLSKYGQRVLEKIVRSESQKQSSSTVNEGRSQIKRKYGEHSNIRVNEKAPVRNKVIEFVGKRFVTESEMEAFLTKLVEERGKDFNNKKWFTRNERYFESFENRGQKVWTLSKYGKRVLEMIKNTQKNINESIGLFKSEVFESLNEGVKTHKGREVYPEWIDPKRDFGNPIKDIKELQQGAEYILWEPGMDCWQAEFIYQGKKGGQHMFSSSTQFSSSDDTMSFNEPDLKDYIKSGDIIKQN